jgi:hypothetical protein
VGNLTQKPIRDAQIVMPIFLLTPQILRGLLILHQQAFPYRKARFPVRHHCLVPFTIL